MTQQGALGKDALAALERLAHGAARPCLVSLVTQARHGEADEADAALLEHAARLSLDLHARWERAQQRAEGLSELLGTARDLLAHSDLDAVLRVITRRARLLLDADVSCVALPDPADGTCRIHTCDDRTGMPGTGLRLPEGAGLAGAVQAGATLARTSDYLNDTRVEHHAHLDARVRARGLRAITAVPIGHESPPLGILYVADRRVRHLSPQETFLISSLGDLAGAALERARTLERARSSKQALAQENTRLNEALEGHRELERVRERLLDQAVSGGSLHTLAEVASRELRGALRIHGANGAVLSAIGRMRESEAAALAQDTASVTEPLEVDDGLWAVPVAVGHQHLGTLLFQPEHPLGDRDRQLLRQVAQAAGVQLLVDTDKITIARELAHGELLEDLLTTPRRPPEQLQERARRLGIDLSSPHVVVVARPEGEFHSKALNWASSYARRMNGLKTVHDDSLVLLLPATDAGAAVRAVSEELSPLFDKPVTAAVAGPVSHAASVFHCHQEALRCLTAMTALGATGRSASARELGFVGVLLADDRDVAGFIDSAIGPVLAYDRQRFTELARTLDAYFESGNSPTQTAQRLHIHPNTVARRLERIGELLGRDWQRQPERAFEVQLALRLCRIRQVLTERPASLPTPGRA